ncbi:MFS transporter [Streptomyces sp. RFCAC02]|uniref:MFS transporter n=1 Tax=Streptomyces sp. RFCAC02 TaxID=2499143 RepID=UPI0010227DF9|nr:MFS transporter [Streptomyces sp. RFCAC02]
MSTTASNVPPRHAAATVVLACLGVFASYLPVVGVSVALPVLHEALDTGTAGLQWISDAFILPTAALLLTCGMVGDLYGRKKVYLAGLAFLCAGSAVCLTAAGVVQVCVGQALTGAGTAALLPSTLGLIGHVCQDPRARARAIAVWTASLGLGLALGPIVTGVIVEHAGWRWMFLPPLVAAALTAAAGVPLLTDSRARRERHLDIPGQLLAVVTITAAVFAVIEGGADGWGSVRAVTGFAVAALALPAFVLMELRSPCPMLDMRLFRSPSFTGAAVVMGVTLFAQVGLVYSLSLYFGLVHHASTLDIGVRLLAVNGFTVVLGPVVGRLMNRTSPGLLLVAGLSAGGVGALGVTLFDASTGTWTAVPVIALFGIGIALAIAPITTITMDSLPHRLAGTAGAANSALRQLGSALGPAVFGVVLAGRTLDVLPGHLAAGGLTAGDQGTALGVVTHAGIEAGGHLRLGTADATAAYRAAYGASFTDALGTCAVIGGTGMLAAAVTAAVLIGVRGRRVHEQAAAPRPPEPVRAGTSQQGVTAARTSGD